MFETSQRNLVAFYCIKGLFTDDIPEVKVFSTLPHAHLRGSICFFIKKT